MTRHKPRLFLDGEWMVIGVVFHRNDGAVVGWLMGIGATWRAAWADYQRRGGGVGPLLTHYPSPITARKTRQ